MSPRVLSHGYVGAAHSTKARYVAALALATAGVFVWVGTLDSPSGSSTLGTAPVVVAAKEITEGRLIDRTLVAVAMWPVPTIPAGSYSSIDSVVNRVARVDVFKGEPVVPGRLAPEGATSGVEVRITPGKRAYSIRINDASGIAGSVMPNNTVDILVMITDQDAPRVKLVMSNVRVLAIGASVQRGADGRPISAYVATLELSPEEVERIAIAASQGIISLALR